MITAVAFFAVAGLAWLAQRSPSFDSHVAVDDDQIRQSVVASRQDLRVIAFLLAGILIMLGFIADRLG
jgi:hypothetical protein